MQWVASHSTALNLLAASGVILVWLFLGGLTLLYHAKLRRPRLLITRSCCQSLDSYCTITNMGQEAAFISMVVAVVRYPTHSYTAEVTNNVLPPQSDDAKQIATFQGPLASAQMFRLNTFRCLAQYVLDSNNVSTPCDELKSIEIRIVATHGRNDHPFGAWRRFDHRNLKIMPASFRTQELTRRWQQPTLRHWLREAEDIEVAHK